MHWTLDQLRGFVAVAEEGSITGAGRRLGYTTGAVSQQMAALESAVGKPLLIRDHRGIEFTDAGAALLPQARRVLEAEREASLTLTRKDGADRLPVSLGVFGSTAAAALGFVTAELARVAPHVQLRSIEMDVEVMPQRVLAGQADVALGLEYPGAPFPPQRGLVVTALSEEPFFIVAPPGIDAPHSPQALRDTANEIPWVIPPAEGAFGRAVRVACSASGISPIEEHVVTDTAVSLALVEAGHGLTMATDLMLRLRPSDTQIWELPQPAVRNIVAFTRRGSTKRESLGMVIEALVAAFAKPSRLP